VLEELKMRDEALEEIATRLGVRAERGKRFAELTSLRVGGAIDWVLSPDTEAQAAAVVHEMDQAGIGWRALGSGSNILADDSDRGAAFFVAQQRVDAVVMLRYEVGGRILARREGGAVNQTKQFSLTKNQRILHRRQFLIEPNLVFIEIGAANKPALVVCFFGIPVSVVPRDLAAFDAEPTNVIQARTRAVHQDYRLDNLFGGKLDVRGRLAVLRLPYRSRNVFSLFRLFRLFLRRLFGGFGILRRDRE